MVVRDAHGHENTAAEKHDMMVGALSRSDEEFRPDETLARGLRLAAGGVGTR